MKSSLQIWFLNVTLTTLFSLVQCLLCASSMAETSRYSLGTGRNGDLHVAVGYSQSTPTSIRADATATASGSPYAGIFGTLFNAGPIGIELEISGQLMRPQIVEAAQTTALTIPLVDLGLGLRVPLFRSTRFSAAGVFGGGGSWAIDRKCGTGDCPFTNSVPNAMSYLRGTLEFRTDELYGLRLSFDHRPGPVWIESIGPVTTATAAFFWSPTAGL